MKLCKYVICILTILFTAKPVVSFQLPGTGIVNEQAASIESREENQKSLLHFLSSFKNNIQPASGSVEEKNVYKVLGVAAIAGFLITVAFFNQDIFSALPLTLLAAGVIFLVLAF
jgi:hypothetical protein